MKKENQKAYIGIDVFGIYVSYCLMKMGDNGFEIVLTKRFQAPDESSKNNFREEVENLAKYFNAKILEEK